MRANGLGCGGWIGAIIVVFILWNICSCIAGKIWDGTQEVLADRHAKQEVADRKARERLARQTAEQHKAEEEELRRKCKADAEREAKERLRLEEDREQAKIAKLRDFALKDAPQIWRAYQQIDASIADQDKRLQDLAGALAEFGKNPKEDADYMAICVMRGEMVSSRAAIRKSLEDAYLASCKFKATPSRKEYAELMRKSLEEGTQAAESATRKFNYMRMEK